MVVDGGFCLGYFFIFMGWVCAVVYSNTTLNNKELTIFEPDYLALCNKNYIFAITIMLLAKYSQTEL